MGGNDDARRQFTKNITKAHKGPEHFYVCTLALN